MPKDVITQKEASELLGVSKQYINKLVKTGKVKSYTGAKLVSENEVRQFMGNSRKAVDLVNQT